MNPLEEREIDPGRHWKIEGYDVYRAGAGRFEAQFGESYLGSARSLDEMRDLIRSAVYGPVPS
jgi:hypothetical protein